MRLEPSTRIVAIVPVTAIAEGAKLHLIAGEDLRFSLAGEDVAKWLPPVMRELRSPRLFGEILEAVAEEWRQNARFVLTRLAEEGLVRVLPDRAPARPEATVCLRGDGDVAGILAPAWRNGPGSGLLVFCQDTLRRDEALRHAAECLASGRPFLWVSSGPVARALVSPVFSAGGRPCLRCFFSVSDSLSPAPDVNRAIVFHDARGGPFERTTLSESRRQMLASLVSWKVDAWKSGEIVPAGLLHVIEWATGTIEAHPLRRNPSCSMCGDG